MKSYWKCPYLVDPSEPYHISDPMKYDELRRYFVNTQASIGAFTQTLCILSHPPNIYDSFDIFEAYHRPTSPFPDTRHFSVSRQNFHLLTTKFIKNILIQGINRFHMKVYFVLNLAKFI